MAVNYVLTTIDEKGITLNGVPFGATRPLYGGTSQIEGLALHSAEVLLPENVNVLGNKHFFVPITFGLNKGILSVNSMLYIPGVDYELEGNKGLWKNPNKSLSVNDEIVVWGPVNEYTAQAMHIETFDMFDPDSFYEDGSDQKLVIKGSGGESGLPYDIQSIYLSVDGPVFAPELDYSYNRSGTKGPELTWLSPLRLDSNSKVFVFFFNKVPTTPYMLGEALIRLVLNPSSLEVSKKQIPLTSLPRKDQSTASQVFFNNARVTDLKDYAFKFPSFQWTSSQTLETSDLLDISYFRDTTVSLNMFNDIRSGSQMNFSAGKYNVMMSNMPIQKSRGLLFLDGVLFIGETYDTITGPAPVPEYNINLGTKLLSYDPDARDPEFHPTASTEVVWTGFTDVYSDNSQKIEYFSGYDSFSLAGRTYTLGEAPADPEKVIVWFGGIAFFSQFGDFTVSGNDIVLPVLSGVPASAEHEVVIWSVNDLSYSKLWKFQVVDVIQNYWPQNGSTLSATYNATLPLNLPVRGMNLTMLFVNGIRQKPLIDTYLIGSNGLTITNTGMGDLPGSYVAVPSKIMLVHL